MLLAVIFIKKNKNNQRELKTFWISRTLRHI